MSEPGTPNAILSATEISVGFGAQHVLDRATVAVLEGERVGLVGRNGTGKSTFLRLAAGDAEPDSGLIVRRRELISGYLPQDFQLDEAATVEENILSGAKAVLDMIQAYEDTPAEDARDGELLERIEHFDGWNLEHRAGSLIDHIGAPAPERVVSTLSGGEKRRVALCRALVGRPDFLILDEPTNHLDTESIEWLEDFLKRYPGVCLFVTHDRYFLDRIATRIVEVAGGVFRSYPGNYTSFLEGKAARMAGEESQEARRQKFLKRELAWVRRGPQARTTKSRERIDKYYAVAEQEAPEEELDVELIIPVAPKLGDRVIELADVGVELGGRVLFDHLTLDITPGMKLGIAGRNGMGKTTLLKLMLGELAPTRGEVKIGARTQINSVDQARLQIDESKTVYQEVGGGADFVKLGDEETVSLRGYLRRFLFTDERVNTKISQLSGGERSRVILAKILKRGGNVLILDEPTNDLDLATLRVLEEALAGFKGSVITVSHDRYFLNRICTSILAFEGRGRLYYDVGNYDDYLTRRGARLKTEAATADSWRKAASAPAKRAARKLTWKEREELDGIEGEILAAEEQARSIEKDLASPEFYLAKENDETRQSRGVTANNQRLKQATQNLEETRKKVTRLYARWEELEAVRAAGG